MERSNEPLWFFVVLPSPLWIKASSRVFWQQSAGEERSLLQEEGWGKPGHGKPIPSQLLKKINTELGGGFKYIYIYTVYIYILFFFYPYLGRWSNLTSIFQMGWNHQLVNTKVQNPSQMDASSPIKGSPHAAENTQPFCCFMKRLLVTPRNLGDITVGGLPSGCLPTSNRKKTQVATQKVRTQVGFFGRIFWSKDWMLPWSLHTTVVGYP